MTRCTPDLAQAGVWLSVSVLLLGLSACSGKSDATPAPAASASAPVLTQSTITLPSSVQVVTAN